MILIPAIDIQGGKVVRLFQGKFSEVTEYADDPLAMAQKWEKLGAKWLHVVDLDGAKTGAMQNQKVIIKIVKALKIPIEVGGGIRDEETVKLLIDAGVSRVILGTKAIENRDFLKKMIKVHKAKICVSLDCHEGKVAQRGWVSTTEIYATDLAAELEEMGLRWMVYTDIAKDGTLEGPNFAELKVMAARLKKINLIASGGVGSIEDIKKLKSIDGVSAAITGKAIYEGKLDIKEALKVC